MVQTKRRVFESHFCHLLAAQVTESFSLSVREKLSVVSERKVAVRALRARRGPRERETAGKAL